MYYPPIFERIQSDIQCLVGEKRIRSPNPAKRRGDERSNCGPVGVLTCRNGMPSNL